MTPEQHQRAKELFAVVMSVSPEQRGAQLDAADDLEVRAEVERLLQAVPTGSSLGVAGMDAVVAPQMEREKYGLLVGRSVAHYEVQRLLGSGGMGEVYLARDRALVRLVALKVLPLDFHPATRDRLLREASVSARVQHPGIATFFDAGHADGVDYIAMEFVSGETLRDRLRSGPLPVTQALEIAAGLLEALVHAHHAGILHRDIKPENVMLTAEGKTKLLDFGLAKAVPPGDSRSEGATIDLPAPEQRSEHDPSRFSLPGPGAALNDANGLDHLTHAGGILGTVGYMAPEQVRGETADARTDVFAVGTLLYELLSGKPAFPGRTPEQRMATILQRDPDPLEGDPYPPGLDRIVRRALARDRSSRYPTASAFLVALREVAGDRARSTHPSSLAILDFRSPPGDSELASLAMTLGESLTVMLGRVADLNLVPRTRFAILGPHSQETLTPSEVGLRLGCSAVLSGSVQRAAAGATLTAQLIDVASGTPTIVQSISGLPTEVAAGLEPLSMAVARALGSHPPVRVEQPSFAATELYARGRRLALGVARGELEEARTLLEHAIALDPNHAAALATLAMVHMFRFNAESDPEHLVRGAECAHRAIEVDPTMGEAYLWGGYLVMHLGRPSEAERMLRRAMELVPSNFLAPYFRAAILEVGVNGYEDLEAIQDPGDSPISRENWWERRLDQAIALLQKSIQLNPMSAWPWLRLGWLQVEKGCFDEARWCLGRAVQLEPRSFPPLAGVAGYMGECLRREGRPSEAQAQFHQGLEALERTDHMYRDTFRAMFLCGLGRTALDEGDVRAGNAAFHQAALHVRGRSKARCSGQALLQALAGLARTGGGEADLDEALSLLKTRRGFDFSAVSGCDDRMALWELYLAAKMLGRREAHEMLERALAAGSVEAHRYIASQPPRPTARTEPS